MMLKFDGIEKVAIVDKDGATNPNIGTNHDCSSNYLTFKILEERDSKKIYVNDYKGRIVGYIDCDAQNQIISEYSYGDVIETMKWFCENYEF